MKSKIVILGAVVLALFAGGLTTALLLGAGPFAKHRPGAAKVAHEIDGGASTMNSDARFVTLDKVIVMLHEPKSQRSHYLALDLVFQTDAKNEKRVKEQLPLLRSTAYRALAPYSSNDIRGMDVDQLTQVLQGAYAKAYGSDALPFSGVQVGKQMLE